MTTRVAINGFGRIGRMVYRRAAELPDVHVVAVNGTSSGHSLAHLLKYDSLHGTWKTGIEETENGFVVNGRETKLLSTRDIRDLPWRDLDVDVVIEATGAFRTRDKLSQHIEQGAKRVVLTAPVKKAQEADFTVVVGVNDQEFNPNEHFIISAASCTTNCLAPVISVLHKNFGVKTGLITTVHSFTNDQRVLDNPHSDLRRARACGQSIIPTSTGAASALGLVIPELKGKLNGISLRVPTPDVSIADVVVQLEQNVDAERVNDVLRRESCGRLANVLGYTDEPLVSMDFLGDSRSAIIDAMSTMVMDDNFVKVLAWYDNEWGYSCRVVDLVRQVACVVVPV